MTKEPHGLSAVFIDFENVYYELKNSIPREREASGYVNSMIFGLKDRLLKSPHRSPVIIARAYADYETIEESVQSSLSLMGVETVHVVGTSHKNSADMRLCIDALEILYTRPEIETYCLFAGDRDYIPLIQHLKRMNKNIYLISLDSNLSGDLKMNVDKDNFFEATMLLGQADHDHLLKLRGQRAASDRGAAPPSLAADPPEKIRSMANGKSVVGIDYHNTPLPPLPLGVALSAPPKFTAVEAPAPHKALKFIVERFGMHKEIFMSPLLRELANEMPTLANHQLRAVLGDLERLGAFKIEKRPGTPYDYAVAVLNYNHPSVRECQP